MLRISRSAQQLFKQACDLQKRRFAEDKSGHSWKWLKDRGHEVNPCRSRFAFSENLTVLP